MHDWCFTLKRDPSNAYDIAAFEVHYWDGIFFYLYFYILFILSDASEVCSGSSVLCIKAYGVFYFINLREEEVLRAADRLHKPPLLHKRRHVLSNCQNLYFKACDRPAVWGSPLLLCRRCLCTSVWLTVCARGTMHETVHAHVLMSVCFLRANTFENACMIVCVYSQYAPPLPLRNLALWSILLKCVALTVRISRCDKWNYAGARREKKLLHLMKHDDGFIARGGP